MIKWSKLQHEEQKNQQFTWMFFWKDADRRQPISFFYGMLQDAKNDI